MSGDRPRVTVAHLRELLDSRSEDPVLYLNGDLDELEVWASAHVHHSVVVMHRHEAVDWLKGATGAAALGDLAEELQGTVDAIEL